MASFEPGVDEPQALADHMSIGWAISDRLADNRVEDTLRLEAVLAIGNRKLFGELQERREYPLAVPPDRGEAGEAADIWAFESGI
ncbi:hypothetical protein AUL38_07750 [Leucobacter sp. G161]|nr:hypothetical protein AUL38_07750 [Leucobacter sp. G161]